ncbi:MAG: hypothetical protein ACP5N7_00425 [Candidatus Pacearchaeota archaeon]
MELLIDEDCDRCGCQLNYEDGFEMSDDRNLCGRCLKVIEFDNRRKE